MCELIFGILSIGFLFVLAVLFTPKEDLEAFERMIKRND